MSLSPGFFRPYVALFLAFVFGLLASAHRASAMERDQAVKLSRAYLASDDEEIRDKLAKKLSAYKGPIGPILSELQARSFELVEAGYHPEESFSEPALLIKHPDDLLYFTVPKSYRPDRATGLIIVLHGGGSTTTRRAPRYFMDFPEEDEDEADTFQLGNILAATDMIAVGPSAPWDEESSYRWCLEESDEYLADVIAECKSRFNIDPNRVILLGHSMGGFGAYHHIQRQPDRFAAVIVNSGSWDLAYLPTIRGTPLCIVQGMNDAVRGERWHYTDIEYARWTNKLLNRLALDHTYFEHNGRHGIHAGKRYIAEYLNSAKLFRRDPYYPRCTLTTPVGFTEDYCFPVTDNRWLTLDETVDGNVEYDALVSNGADDFDDWELSHTTCKLRGATIDAVNRGDNTFEVATQNVARFTIWLHPRMVDVEEPVKIMVNDELRFDGRVKPSLLTAIQSYERRGDWGLVYSIKVELTDVDW